jgi:hypothetical protein
MAELLENIQQTEEKTTEIVETPNYFAEGGWKTEPSQAQVAEPLATSQEPIKEEVIPIVEKPAEVVAEHPKGEEKPIAVKSAEPEPLKFANEESEKVFNLLKEGKIDDVYSIISEQKKLASVDKLPPADIIKLNLQYQNKDFSESEINDLFEETYTMPEKPVQSLTEDDDEFKVREEKYKAQVERLEKRIARDAKPATAELLKLSKEIVLPNIQKQEPINNEPTQEELDAQKVLAEKFLKTVDDGLQVFNGYQTTFKDEEVELTVGYKLTKEEKDEIKPLLELSNSNGVEFLTKIGWLNEKGEINTAKLTEDLPLILNKTKVINKLVTETGNQRLAAAKKAIKNVDFSGGNKAGNGDMGASPEQLQQQMATHFFSN